MRISIILEALTGSFETDMKRASKEAQRASKQMEADFKRMGVAVGAAMATAAVAVAALTKKAINNADEIGKAAQKIGTSTEKLSGLAYAAKLADVELGGLQIGLLKLTKNMTDGNAAFAAIGVSVTDSKGRMRDVVDVFGDVSEVISKMPEGALKTRLSLELLGKSGANMLPLMNEGRDGLKEMSDEAERLGVVIDDRTAKAAENFNDDLTRLGLAFDGIFIKVAQDVLPVLDDLVQKFKDPEFRDGITALATGAANAIVYVAKLAAELGNLARFAGESVAARLNGPAAGDIVRLEDAVARQREVIRQLDQSGTGAERRNTSSYADEQRRELLNLTAQLNAARDAAEQLAIQQWNLDEAARNATGEVKEQTATEREAEQARKDATAALEAYFNRLKQSAEGNKALGAAERERAKALREAEADWKRLDDVHQHELMTLEEQERAMREVRDEFNRAAADIQTETKLLGMSTQERQKALIALEAERLARDKNGVVVENERKRYQDLLTTLQKAESLESIRLEFDQSAFSDLLSDIDKLREAIEGALDPDIAKALTAQIAGKTLNSFQALLGAVQTFTNEGSKGFKNIEKGMAALSIVQDIIALKAAVTAVLSQGQGEPYSAWARMAAMAAAVAPMLASIGLTISSFGGGGGGGGSSGAEARQATQGRGTVLGDAEAQSESIRNAVEITAEATSNLVGINRGMLSALQAMQAGISGASGGIARTGFGELSLDGAAFANAFGPLPTILGSLLGSIFGGDQDLIDQGLLVRGGSFGSVAANPNASSYQTIETDGGWFGSDDIDDELEALGEEVTTQIQLILGSIGDAVRAGAEALGVDAAQINAAIEAFRIEEIRISTMDLSGEEAQAEIEAAFSAIFDELAGAVVPFIDQFQRVGEGLGETLIRVATSVQVVQEGMYQLGLSMEALDPERMAQVSVALIDAVGGIDAFIEGMQSFVSNFAPASRQFAVAQDEINRAFAQAGLTVPATRDGMWELMQSLDATTDSGREQIATLLRLGNVADTYYDVLESRANDAAEAAAEAAAIEAEAAASRAEALAASQETVGQLIIGFGEQWSDAQRAINEWDMSPLARELAGIEEETRVAIAIAAANGASPAQLLVLSIQGIGRAAAAATLAALEFADSLAEWEFEEALAGMTELEQTIARSDQLWQERLRQAIELFGEDSTEATRVVELWGNATTRFTEAAAAAAETLIQYTGSLSSARRTVGEILQEANIGVRGDGLTERQRAIAEINARFDAFERGVRDSMIGFSGSITARELMEEKITKALIELGELRLEALTNLELESIGDVEDAIQERYQRELDWLRQLGELQDSLLLDPTLSTLTPEQMLAEAKAQYEEALAGSMSGDEDARAGFDEAARNYLAQARDFFASSQAYQDIFGRVTGDISGLIESSPATAAAAQANDVIANAVVATITELRDDSEDQTDAIVARLERIETESSNSNVLLESVVAELRKLGTSNRTLG
ncbi:MAG: hypothetical protein M3Q42_10425 [Pseudomonadota bacterium]|nr:hypothetical protein [Pseudomonadota bacterium]